MFQCRKKSIKKNILASVLYFLIAVAIFILLKNNMFAFAGGKKAAEDAFKIVIKAVRVIGSVSGALFVLVGIIRFVISHANEDGPNQQKAALMIATGVALIIVVSIISSTDISSMVDFTGDNGSGGGTTTNAVPDNSKGVNPNPSDENPQETLDRAMQDILHKDARH